jgi:hypothetical protein
MRDITVGDNGGYSAATGWDACTGLGTPHGDLVIAAFASGGRTPVSASGAGASGTAGSEAAGSGAVGSGSVASGPAAAPQAATGLPGGSDGADSGTSPNEFSW